MSAKTPAELDILLHQASVDNATALQALAELQRSERLTGIERGHLANAVWSITASQFHLARVGGLLRTTRED